MELVAFNLKRLKALPLAAEIFKKLGDESQVVQLHVEANDWAEAFRLAECLPKLLPNVHYQYARWLAESDQFIEAHQGNILMPIYPILHWDNISNENEFIKYYALFVFPVFHRIS